MAKIVCVLYDDPVDGYPPAYPRDEIPKIERYPDGQTTPTPSAIDFSPGELLGCVSGELGLRKFLEEAGHELVVTSDKDGRPGTQSVPATGILAIAAASSVSATMSSGSRLCTWDLPQARASVWDSSTIARR